MTFASDRLLLCSLMIRTLLMRFAAVYHKHLRQLILDYYVMGMRPKEILTHVGDLSWSDLQERDRLWLRLATTNAHQGAEPQASQLKAKAPLPSTSAGDASSDTEDQVPSTPGEMQCAESVSQSGLSNGFAPILQLISCWRWQLCLPLSICGAISRGQRC